MLSNIDKWLLYYVEGDYVILKLKYFYSDSFGSNIPSIPGVWFHIGLSILKLF